MGGKRDDYSSSSESEDEVKKDDEKSQEWEKKRHRKTRDDIEREALLMGDLYAILGLEDKTYEAKEYEIKSAYRSLVL